MTGRARLLLSYLVCIQRTIPRSSPRDTHRDIEQWPGLQTRVCLRCAFSACSSPPHGAVDNALALRCERAARWRRGRPWTGTSR